MRCLNGSKVFYWCPTIAMVDAMVVLVWFLEWELDLRDFCFPFSWTGPRFVPFSVSLHGWKRFSALLGVMEFGSLQDLCVCVCLYQRHHTGMCCEGAVAVTQKPTCRLSEKHISFAWVCVFVCMLVDAYDFPLSFFFLSMWLPLPPFLSLDSTGGLNPGSHVFPDTRFSFPRLPFPVVCLVFTIFFSRWVLENGVALVFCVCVCMCVLVCAV